MNQQALIKKIKKMQDEMMQTQKEIEETIFSGTAGGVVSIEMTGTKELKAVHIASDFMIEGKEDIEMLEEMIVSACRQTYHTIDKTTKEKMEKYSALLNMGGLF
ncbi:MAG: YbaB/EbfC family nucleoid-associated protein [Bacilli bacterium]|jgi:DNA-binding YbaB/EbfC family protein|nr:YbaB/EbfC family nucleoid-associated protein [Bacilli bacterium]